MRTTILTMGLVLGAYCSAGALSETAWQHNEKVDAALCDVFLCNAAPRVWQGRDLVATGKQENIHKAIGIFRRVLHQDPQDPYRWADLGEAFLVAGQRDEARYCYSQVSTLAPRTAPLLLEAAEFHLGIGETKEGLAITAKILGLIPNYDPPIFKDYTRFVGHPEDVLQYGLPDARAAGAWLEFLMQSGREDDAQLSWKWLVNRGDANDVLAGKYVGFLIRQGHPDLASSTWALYLGTRAKGYGVSEYLFNGRFETEPLPSPFDWTIGKTEGAELTRDCGASSGKCSLRISFDGSHNVDFVAASQLSFVHAGHYRFRVRIRTEQLTTDEGIRFRILDAEAPSRLGGTFGKFTGTNPWSDVTQDFVVVPATRLLKIQIFRQPSLRFDNKISGVAWVDDLVLTPTTDAK